MSWRSSSSTSGRCRAMLLTTRWNSTFDMLNFALEYRKAIQNLTGDEDLSLEKYKLTRNEFSRTRRPFSRSQSRTLTL
ncbi:hypothetical protein BJ912DRAFT_175477 [Pholiota molesta]|nr:hypothetical protein BJ912DRAFT_175477 [Pholiota molesta]